MAAITDTRDKLRLELGDVDPDDFVFNNDELDYFLSAESNDVLKARLRAAEAAAFRFARAYDFATDGQSFKRSQMGAAYTAMAKQLRDQGVITSSDVNGISTVDVTVKDGYSDDIANSEVQAPQSGRRRFAWGEQDDVIP